MNRNVRILHVEDEADIRDITELALEDEGFTLLQCSGGNEAVDVAEAFQPELIVLDVMMPGMDGPTTLHALRKLPGLAATPVVFMTAKVQPGELTHLKGLGAVAVVAKPFDPMTLADRLHTILAAC